MSFNLPNCFSEGLLQMISRRFMKLKICWQALKDCRKLPGIHSRFTIIPPYISCVEFYILDLLVDRILESHQREQKESYETQVEGLKLKMDHLQNESSKLQNLFQEKSNVNENIRLEVSRLSSENAVRYFILKVQVKCFGIDAAQNKPFVLSFLCWNSGYT